MRAPYLLVIASMVVGCGHVPVTSLPKLSRLDMMTLDARQLRVAVDMPDGLRVQTDSAVIITGLKASSAGPAVEERFVLEEVEFTEPGGTPPEGAQVFRIPEADLPRLSALRDLVRQRKKAFPKETRGYLTVTTGGCRTASLPSGPLLVDTLLKTSDAGTYFVLTNDVDLRKLVPMKQLVEKVPLCG